jgi:hypothetical protein
VALLVLLAGAWLGRCAVATRLRDTFATLAQRAAELTKQEGASSRALLDRLAEDAQAERIGAAILGAGCLLVLVTSGAATRASAFLLVSVLLVGSLATALDVAYPSSLLPGIATVTPPPDEWPEGAVRAEPGVLHAFIIISEKKEWAGRVGFSDLGPQGLAEAVERRLATSRRPVRLFSDPRCPDEARRAFAAALEPVVRRAGVELDEELLCDPQDFPAKRKMLYEEELSQYRDGAIYSSLARFAWAIALGMLVWRADVRSRGTRGVVLVAGAQLVLALGQVVALPVLLYVGMLPEERYFKNPFEHLGENAFVYEAVLFASSALIAVGALAMSAGQFLVSRPSPSSSPVSDGDAKTPEENGSGGP